MLESVRSNLYSLRLFKSYLEPGRMLDIAKPLFTYHSSRDGKASTPINLNLEVTSRCNLKCSFCNYFPNRPSEKEELSISELISLVDSAKGRPSVFIGGGEPFMRNDIFRLLEHLSRKGNPFGIVTNGYFLDKGKIDRLVDLGIENILFSLHGLEGAHGDIVGNSHAFRRLTDNIRYICSLKRRPAVIVNFVPDEKNIDQIEQVAGLCSDLGADFFRVQHQNFILPKEMAQTNARVREEFGMDHPVVRDHELCRAPDLSERLISFKNRKHKIEVIMKPYLTDAEIRSWYSADHTLRRPCYVLWTAMVVHPGGDVSPCHYYDYSLGNIRKADLSEIWNSERAVRFRKAVRQGLLPACQRCCRI